MLSASARQWPYVAWAEAHERPIKLDPSLHISPRGPEGRGRKVALVDARRLRPSLRQEDAELELRPICAGRRRSGETPQVKEALAVVPPPHASACRLRRVNLFEVHDCGLAPEAGEEVQEGACDLRLGLSGEPSAPSVSECVQELLEPFAAPVDALRSEALRPLHPGHGGFGCLKELSLVLEKPSEGLRGASQALRDEAPTGRQAAEAAASEVLPEHGELRGTDLLRRATPEDKEEQLSPRGDTCSLAGPAEVLLRSSDQLRAHQALPKRICIYIRREDVRLQLREASGQSARVEVLQHAQRSNINSTFPLDVEETEGPIYILCLGIAQLRHNGAEAFSGYAESLLVQLRSQLLQRAEALQEPTLELRHALHLCKCLVKSHRLEGLAVQSTELSRVQRDEE
mmetsp:Transcript_48733/g.105935  ORF Transcript_48733/g.105935 Transcript_48733/m.105935 type:complete len:401 (-) Transcript_48733:782-1984(-)